MYRAIAFHAPDLKGLPQLLDLFPAGRVELAHDPVMPFDGFGSARCYYYSTEQPPGVEVAADRRKTILDKTYFRYEILLFHTLVGKRTVLFVAVPSLQMALEVYAQIRDAGRGRQFRYEYVNLPCLLSAISKGRHLAGALTITGLRFKVDGDGLIDTFSLSGQDIPNSETLRLVQPEVQKALERKGISLSPDRLRLSLSGADGHLLKVELDNAGHFKLWLGRKASSLPSVSQIMSFFETEDLIQHSATFPYLRRLKEEVAEAKESQGG